MEENIVRLITNGGFGVLGFVFAYLLLKFFIGKFSQSLDKIINKLDKNSEKSEEGHREIMKQANHTSEALAEIVEKLKKLNGK